HLDCGASNRHGCSTSCPPSTPGEYPSCWGPSIVSSGASCVVARSRTSGPSMSCAETTTLRFVPTDVRDQGSDEPNRLQPNNGSCATPPQWSVTSGRSRLPLEGPQEVTATVMHAAVEVPFSDG